MERKKINILSNILGGYRRSSEEYLFCCPKKDCSSDKLKLSINIAKNVFKCWICDFSGRDISFLITRYGSVSDKRRWSEFDEKVEIFAIEELFSHKEEVEKIINLPQEFQTLTSRNNLLISNQARNYLNSRKVTARDILLWKIGFCPSGHYKGRIIIPSFNKDGDVNYFVARSYSDNWLKYSNPPASRNNIIFNELYLDFKEDLNIVEGIFDAIISGINSVPLLGSTLSENSKLFRRIVENNTKVFLALDADAKKKTIKIIRKLISYGIGVYEVNTGGYSDVGEMPREVFLKRRREASRMNLEKAMIMETIAA